MPGKRLNSQARSLVANLIDYFATEKENGGPLISVNAIQQRVADALKISLRTVASIKVQAEKDEISCTPGKSRPRLKSKTEDLPETQKMEVRNVIYNLYSEGKHVTLRSLKNELSVKHILDADISTLSKLLSSIGFKFKQDDNRRALMERTNVVLMRNAFFRKYTENERSVTPKQLVFLDETWIFSKGSKTKSWQDDSTKSVRKPGGYEGKRYIVLHAGNSKGFIDNAALIYSTKSKLADYHGDMSGDIFMKWLREKLVPNLQEPSVIIMDNAPYHSIQVEKQPTSSWNKSQIVRWLEESNIVFNKNMFKAELLNIAKYNRKPLRYKVDEFLEENGHQVLRLPPYHCQFNAIEMIWAHAKDFYNKHIGEEGYGDDKVLAMWEKALQRCNPEIWAACVRHTENLIKEWYNREHVLDNIPEIIININDNESESESEHSSDSI